MGRIGRLGYFVGILYLFVPVVIVDFGYMIMTAMIGGQLDSPVRSILDTLLFLFGAAWMLLYFYEVINLTIRRFHDTGRPGWFTLLLLIPMANALVFLFLLFAPGDTTKNRYGRPVSGLGVGAIFVGE